ncbi:MAG: archaellin/type IV pilin N-terminal domain-containing protein [Dehalococcoidia bacterium]
MLKPTRLLSSLHKREEGVTGLETAIILIAFVIVASVFAFVVLSTGLFSADRGKETVFSGLDKARGSLEVRGAVTVSDVNSDGAVNNAGGDTIVFSLANSVSGAPVSVDPAATTNSTIMNYIDAQGRVGDATYTVSKTLGDADDLLENGELFQITIVIPAGSSLAANETFTVEVVPPSGGTSLINRTMPQAIDQVMDLR